MAGLPKSVNTDTPIDSHFLSYINNLSTGGNTTNITTSKDSIKQYVKTKNGIFNGAFGSIGHSLVISSGTLDLTANSTGAVVVRRMIYVMPESSTSDTIDNIETNGLELPYQELTLVSSTNNTITIAHDASGGGTTKNIYCPGDTNYVLAPNEAVKLIYDPINTIWIVTGNVSSSSGVELGDTNIWTGTNTFQSAVSMTGASVVLGDSSTDLLYINSTISGNIDMGDNDINTLDRLLFSATGTNNLATTDYGIATDSTDTNQLHYNVPSGKNHRFDVAGTQVFSINGVSGVTAQIGLWVQGSLTATGDVTFQGDVEIGSSSSDNISIDGTVDTDITFATGGTISFYDILSSTPTGGSAPALPSQPIGYFTVKFRTGTRYIPYYS